MIPFTEGLRYSHYGLTPDSTVLDFGGHQGSFAKTLAERYGCRVFVYEPIPVFYQACVASLSHLPTVKVFNHGVGRSKRHINMRIKGDSTGAFADSGELVDVQLMSIGEIMQLLGLETVQLVKLNIEGMEAETIEGMLDDGTIKRIENLQVQPHTCMPNALTRWPEIQRRLAETHELTYCEPWCWENWRLKA